MNKTYSQKAGEVTRDWVVIDASTTTLGRVASVAANQLIGKNKPSYTPHVDGGDFVIVINTDKVKTTGNKDTQKIYYRHSGYPGGTKAESLKTRKVRDSRGIIENAVKGMLPKNKLQNERMKRLKIFTGSEHPHAAQKPRPVSISEGDK